AKSLSHSSQESEGDSLDGMPNHDPVASLVFTHDHDGDSDESQHHPCNLDEAQLLTQDEITHHSGDGGGQGHDQHGHPCADFNESLEQEHVTQNKAHKP